MCNEPHEGVKTRFPDLVVNGQRDFEELPHLTAFEDDLQNAPLLAIGQAFDLRVEDGHPGDVERFDEMPTQLYLLIALSAEDQGAKTSAQILPYRCSV